MDNYGDDQPPLGRAAPDHGSGTVSRTVVDRRAPAEVRGYDPGRMRRAASLACVKIGERQYRVRGQVQPHYDVDLNTDPACYCADQNYRGEMCKHEICARLHDGDPKLMQALGDMLLAAEKRAKELEKRTRHRKAS